VIGLGCLFLFWIVREILFLEFVRTFKQTFFHFVTQFDQDQKTIHNIIEDNFKRHKEMEREMDEKSKEFHHFVNQSMYKTFAYLNKDTNPSPMVHKSVHEISAHETVKEVKEEEDEKLTWEKLRISFIFKAGKELPSYEELEKVVSMNGMKDAYEKELDLLKKKQSEMEMTWKKERQALYKNYWEKVRQYYLQVNGKSLPSYDELKEMMREMRR
jgi:hypothetical protein